MMAGGMVGVAARDTRDHPIIGIILILRAAAAVVMVLVVGVVAILDGDPRCPSNHRHRIKI